MRLRFAAAFLVLVPLSAFAAAVPSFAGGDETTAKVDKIFAEWDTTVTPGAALAVVREGKIIYERGYGMASLEDGLVMTPSKVFDVGSVSKQFTAACVTLLVAEGKIGLEDDIRKYLPEIPAYEKPITVGHLLHHTSGLRDYNALLELAGFRADADCPTVEEALRIICLQRKLTPPQDIPPGLEAIILKCLSKRPEQRYPSMKELLSDIEKLRDGLVPEAVAEMMSRSGGFNVPNDFFKVQGRMPAPVPATPFHAGRKQWPLIAGAAGVAVAVGLVVAIFAHSSVSPASSTASAQVAEPAKAPATASTLAPPATDLVVSTPVAIAVEPIDAEVFLDGQSLGTSPVVVEVPDGKVVVLDVKRSGYASQKVTLDGKESKLMVRLERERGGAAVRGRPVPGGRPAAANPEPPAPRPRPKSGIGGGEIVNPWGR